MTEITFNDYGKLLHQLTSKLVKYNFIMIKDASSMQSAFELNIVMRQPPMREEWKQVSEERFTARAKFNLPTSSVNKTNI